MFFHHTQGASCEGWHDHTVAAQILELCLSNHRAGEEACFVVQVRCLVTNKVFGHWSYEEYFVFASFMLQGSGAHDVGIGVFGNDGVAEAHSNTLIVKVFGKDSDNDVQT